MLTIMCNESANRCWKYLTRRPGSAYRQLFVDGRIAAWTIYCQALPGDDWPGMTPEGIAEDFDLPIEAVQEALAYCESKPPEIHEDWEIDQALLEATGMNDPNYKYHPSPRILSPEEWERICRR